MNDLVKRLRDENAGRLTLEQALRLMDEAANEIERLQALLMKACDPDRINVHVLKPTEEMVKREVIEDMRAWEPMISDPIGWLVDLDTYCKEKGLE